MTSFVAVLLWFFLSFLLHTRVHRYISGIIVYTAGGLLLSGFGRAGNSEFPWSSGFLFLLLSVLALLFYTTLSYGTEVPTSVILRSFRKKPEQKLNDLMGLFTDKSLMSYRVGFLTQHGLATRSHGVLHLTGKGSVIVYLMTLYKRVFGRTQTE